MSALRLPSFSAPLPKNAPYVLQSDEGETVTLIGSGSVMRYLTTGEETDDTFAIVHTRARSDEPVPAHFHSETHDTFLCLSGSMKVWTNDQCRVLLPGDFCSVPPKVVHAFEICSPETELLGVIAPGSWIKFFGFISDPYPTSPLFPVFDHRAFPVPLMIEAIKSGCDVKPVTDYKYPEVREPEVAENTLPSSVTPYYLRANTGPRYFLGSQSLSPLITSTQSASLFSISLLAGLGPSSAYPSFPAARAPELSGPLGRAKAVFASTNHFLRVVEGKLRVTVDTVDGQEETTDTLTAGEGLLVPAGKGWRYDFVAPYSRAYVFSGKGGGLEEVFMRAGVRGREGQHVGEKSGEGEEDAKGAEVDEEKVREALKAVDAKFV